MTCFAAADGVHWGWLVLGLLSVPALVALNGFFVAAEFALVAVRKTRVEEMARRGVPRAAAVKEAVTHLDRYIAATQLGITLASIALGWVGEASLARLVQPLLESALPAGWAGPMSHTVAVAVAFTAITFMHVVFGELIPKSLALQSPDRTALWVAAPLVGFARVARPFIALMNGAGNAILRRAGYAPAGAEATAHSVEELGMLIGHTEEAGGLSAQQAAFVRKVFTLSGRRVSDCMVPREKMAAIALGTAPDRILEVVRQGAHTRMPVYDGDLDTVVGIVNTKDLFYLFSLKGVVVLEDALYPPLFLKPDDNVADALELFRRERRPLAVVREPGGPVLGLVTMENVLEEIVGDIEDEHDAPLPKVRLRKRRR